MGPANLAHMNTSIVLRQPGETTDSSLNTEPCKLNTHPDELTSFNSFNQVNTFNPETTLPSLLSPLTSHGRHSDTSVAAGTCNAASTTVALGRAVHMDASAVQLKYFTDPSLLRQLGHNRLARLFQDFERDLMDAENRLPFPSPEDAASLDRLAAAFGRTDW